MYSTTSSTKPLYATAIALLGLLPTTALADWSGGYAGASVGFLTESEATAEIDGDDFSATIEGNTIFGAFGGYQVQQGDFVFGGEIAISSADDFEIEIEDDVNSADFRLFDIKARAGYDLGDALIYGVAGLSQINISGDDVDEDADSTAEGFNFGFGADYQINDQFVVGAEYLARRLVVEDEDDTDVTADTLSVRASFNF